MPNFNLLDAVRRPFSLSYGSLPAQLHANIKNAARFIRDNHNGAAKDGVRRHIHSPEVRQFLQATRYEESDWVENCTALVKRPDGTMEVLDWEEMIRAETGGKELETGDA